MATFVLVHGAWHGGWCWRRVADLLVAGGHRVFTPTLTGLADRSHLLSADVTVATHVADIVNLVRWENLSGIVLVGHSYAGIVGTEVAEQIGDRIGALVLLDAFYPQPGDSLFSLGSENIRCAISDAGARGDLTLKPIPAAMFNVNAGDRAWVDSQCTPQPLGTFLHEVSGVGGRERVPRKAYIRATGYGSTYFDAGLALTRADASWRTYELPCGHDVMLDMPERLSEILLEVA